MLFDLIVQAQKEFLQLVGLCTQYFETGNVYRVQFRKKDNQEVFNIKN